MANYINKIVKDGEEYEVRFGGFVYIEEYDASSITPQDIINAIPDYEEPAPQSFKTIKYNLYIISAPGSSYIQSGSADFEVSYTTSLKYKLTQLTKTGVYSYELSDPNSPIYTGVQNHLKFVPNPTINNSILKFKNGSIQWVEDTGSELKEYSVELNASTESTGPVPFSVTWANGVAPTENQIILNYDLKFDGVTDTTGKTIAVKQVITKDGEETTAYAFLITNNVARMIYLTKDSSGNWLGTVKILGAA